MRRAAGFVVVRRTVRRAARLRSRPLQTAPATSRDRRSLVVVDVVLEIEPLLAWRGVGPLDIVVVDSSPRLVFDDLAKPP